MRRAVIGFAVPACVAIACSRSPAAGVSKAEVRQAPAVRKETARPVEDPYELSQLMAVGGEVSFPKLISGGMARWPDPNGCYELGTVTFDAVIDRDGRVRDLKLLKGPADQFTRAAQEAFSQRKYAPAMYRGKPVPVKLTVTINHVPRKKVNGPC